MKSILFLFLPFIILTSCSSTDKLIREGKYDKAFKKSLKKVIRKPDDEKSVINLGSAYNKAQEKSKSIIKELTLSGNPDIWDNVYHEYLKMKGRYEKISPVLPLKYKGKNLQIEKDDYAALAMEAKKKAAEYHYALGKKLLSYGDKYKCRDAYYEFDKVLSYFNNYKDAESLKNKALGCGIAYVAIYFDEKNSDIKLIPEDRKLLFAFDENDFNSFWVRFEAYINDKKIPQSDYYIEVTINKIIFYPERVENNTYKVEKRILDGEEYVRDENGNIVTDSTGHPLTQPVYRNVFCIVKETLLKKDAEIEVGVKIVDGISGNILKKSVLRANQHFRYEYAQANGDLRVLDDRQRELISHRPAGFPPNEEFITELIKNVSRELYGFIKDNRRMLK